MNTFTLNKSNFKKIFALTFGIAFLSMGFLQTPASAQSTDDRGILISPAISELEADRGGIYQLNIKVENNTPDQTLQMNTSLNTFVASDTEGVPIIQPISSDSDLANWVDIKQPEFKLKPGEKFESLFDVNVPSEAEPGSYFLAVTYSDGGVPTEQDKNLLVMEKRVAALVFINVKGQVQKEVEFSRFDTNKTIYDPFFDDFKLDYKILIDGNSYLKPSGNIFLESENGEDSVGFNLNPDQKIILPDSARSFDLGGKSAWQFPLLNEKASSNRQIELPKQLFGKKIVRGTVLYSKGDGQISRQETRKEVFFFPWKLSLLVISVIMLIAGAAGFGYLKFKQKSKVS